MSNLCPKRGRKAGVRPSSSPGGDDYRRRITERMLPLAATFKEDWDGTCHSVLCVSAIKAVLLR